MKKNILTAFVVCFLAAGLYGQEKKTQSPKPVPKPALTHKDSATIGKLTIEAKKNEPSSSPSPNRDTLIINPLRGSSKNGINDVIDVDHEIKTK